MNMKLSLRKSAVIALSAIALTIGVADNAEANLVVDGDFSAAIPNLAIPAGNLNSTSTSWNYAGGVAYVYASGTADTTGGALGPIYLWGPGNPTSPSPNTNSLNGLTASSPDGGNYLASDSDSPYSGAFFQSISGLIPGNAYVLTFWYAAAQFRNPNGTLWNGATHSLWRVSLGTAGTYDTPDLKILDHGFSGWIKETHTFTVPTASTGPQILQFLAVGGPSGLPPVALLDGVSLVAVPEPATYTLMILGLLGVLAAGKRKKIRT